MSALTLFDDVSIHVLAPPMNDVVAEHLAEVVEEAVGVAAEALAQRINERFGYDLEVVVEVPD